MAYVLLVVGFAIGLAVGCGWRRDTGIKKRLFRNDRVCIPGRIRGHPWPLELSDGRCLYWDQFGHIVDSDGKVLYPGFVSSAAEA